MVPSDDGQYIAFSVGKNLITGIEVLVEIIIMLRDTERNEFSVIKRIDMDENEMTDVCKQICFDKKHKDSLVFVTRDNVLRMNFLTSKKYKVLDFITNFDEQPEFFIFNEDQTVCIITTEDDTLMINF